jgi:hypothetical protein
MGGGGAAAAYQPLQSEVETGEARSGKRMPRRRSQGEVKRGRPKPLASGRRGPGTAGQPSLAGELEERSLVDGAAGAACGADAQANGGRGSPPTNGGLGEGG